MHEMLRQLEALERNGSPAALATLVAARGTTPKRAGATMVVDALGRIVGSVTIGGCVDARVIEAADAVVRQRRSRLLTLDLDDDEAAAIGLTCGGMVEVLIEPVDARIPADPVVTCYAAARRELSAGRRAAVVAPLPAGSARLAVGESGIVAGSLGDSALDALVAAHVARHWAADAAPRARVETVDTIAIESRLYFDELAPAETVVIVGAGEIAVTLARFAHELGMRVVVIDGRERYATRERFPAADDVQVGIPSELVAPLLRRGVYVVLVAHDYKYELPVLREALRSEASYIGMLGSRRRSATIKQMLTESGVSADEIARLHSPIGLDLGGRSAPEIALAIAAELIAVREGKRPLAAVAAPAGLTFAAPQRA